VPAVTITDPDGDVVISDMRVVDLNTIELSVSIPFAGVAYFS
jgi:hypothetical protein